MKHMRDRLLGALLVAALAASGVAGAGDEEPSDAPVRSAPPPQASADQARLAVYVPPSRGSTRVRAGGGTRGIQTAEALQLEVLAPDHVGLTLREQPTLAWFVSGAQGARVDFTLIGEDAIDPVTEVSLAGPFEPGVHLVRLADLGVHLEPEAIYEWSVAVVVDPEQRDRDLYSGGAIQRTELPGLASSRAGEVSIDELARRGVWYDAIAELCEAIAKRPQDEALRAERAALLGQVGLEQAASYDRQRGGGDASMRRQAR